MALLRHRASEARECAAHIIGNACEPSLHASSCMSDMSPHAFMESLRHVQSIVIDSNALPALFHMLRSREGNVWISSERAILRAIHRSRASADG